MTYAAAAAMQPHKKSWKAKTAAEHKVVRTTKPATRVAAAVPQRFKYNNNNNLIKKRVRGCDLDTLLFIFIHTRHTLKKRDSGWCCLLLLLHRNPHLGGMAMRVVSLHLWMSLSISLSLSNRPNMTWLPVFFLFFFRFYTRKTPYENYFGYNMCTRGILWLLLVIFAGPTRLLFVFSLVPIYFHLLVYKRLWVKKTDLDTHTLDLTCLSAS